MLSCSNELYRTFPEGYGLLFNLSLESRVSDIFGKGTGVHTLEFPLHAMKMNKSKLDSPAYNDSR